MKILLRICNFLLLLFSAGIAYSQCSAGYTQATLVWDNLNYYYNSGGGAPYSNYVTNVMEQTQNFAIGTTYVTFATSASGIVKGQNASYTAGIASYTGNNAQFTPSANGQTITLTFSADVQNVKFTLYDVDLSQVIHIDAYNSAAVAQNVSVTLQASTILTTTNNNSTNTFVTASATSLTNDNRGTATIATANNVSIRSIKLTISTKGTDPTFWLSKMYACVTGSFPTNDQQKAACKPFTGQPDYILVTPDNQSVYKVDPVTGKAWYLFKDVSQPYVNSLAYDQVNHWLYYVTDGSGSPSINKQLKKYDFSTGTSSVVLNDITGAPLNIPTFDQGVESAAADFYNGSLYLGIEGGRYDNSNTRYSNVYKIDFNAGGTPIDAVQVYCRPAYNGSTSMHDWGDFIAKDGTIIDFNTARSGGGPFTYPNSTYIHYDLMTGTITNTYPNGTPSQPYAGQAAKQWYGNLYTFQSSGLKLYNMIGGEGSTISITAVTGGWPGGAGDGAGPYRPPMDFGDAPSSYDPSSGDPAVHEIDAMIHLGNNVDSEWLTRGQTAAATSDNYDDGLSYVPIFNPSHGDYLTQCSVFNNTGANATVCAWLDFNNNGVFDASEGITVTVPSSASQQNVWLYWPPHATTLVDGSYTYLRIRITYASNGMTTSDPTGYYNSGEVEDYRVTVNAYPLAVQLTNFDAQLTSAKKVDLTWNLVDETNVSSYVIEKSLNGTDWQMVSGVEATGKNNYKAMDPSASKGTSYYRLKILNNDGTMRLSTIKKVDNNVGKLTLLVAPNPAITKAVAYISSVNISPTPASVEIINAQGAVVDKEKLLLQNGINSFDIPVMKFSSGHYLIRVVTDADCYSQTLIITK